jgi:hypothetical protein
LAHLTRVFFHAQVMEKLEQLTQTAFGAKVLDALAEVGAALRRGPATLPHRVGNRGEHATLGI